MDQSDQFCILDDERQQQPVLYYLTVDDRLRQDITNSSGFFFSKCIGGVVRLIAEAGRQAVAINPNRSSTAGMYCMWLQLQGSDGQLDGHHCRDALLLVHPLLYSNDVLHHARPVQGLPHIL